jgi:hypothetical protein
VHILPSRIYPYSGCRRLKQSSEATNKVAEFSCEVNTLGEAHASEVHTFGVHTPLKDTTLEHHITTTIQFPTLICDVGPTCSYPHISMAKAGLTHSGERRSTRKVYVVRREIRGLSITSGHGL